MVLTRINFSLQTINRLLKQNNHLLINDANGKLNTLSLSLLSFLDPLSYINATLSESNDLNSLFETIIKFANPTLSFNDIFFEGDTQEKINLPLIKSIILFVAELRKQSSINTFNSSQYRTVCSKLLALTGRFISHDCHLEVEQMASIPLPPYLLQLCIICLCKEAVHALPFTNKQLRQLAIYLAPGFSYFKGEYIEALFEVVCSQITLNMLSDPEDPSTSSGPALFINSSQYIQPLTYNSYCADIILELGRRVKGVYELYESLPFLKKWLQLSLSLDPYNSISSIQQLLAEKNVNYKLILQILFLINPSWVGHSNPSNSSDISSQNCLSCSLIPYLFKTKSWYSCYQCSERIERVGLICMGCKVKYHIHCGEIIESKTNKDIFYGGNSMKKIYLDDGREFIRVTNIRTEICQQCSEPIWGVCVQGLLCLESLKFYHLDCIVGSQLPSQYVNSKGIPFDIEDFLNNKRQGEKIESFEYLILRNYLEIQIALALCSKSEKVKASVESMQDVLDRFDLLIPEGEQNSIAITYSYHQLQSFLTNPSQYSGRSLSYPDFQMKEFTFKDFYSSLFNTSRYSNNILICYLEIHGLIDLYPKVNSSLELYTFTVVSPFSFDHLSSLSSELNIKALNNIIGSNESEIIEHGFHLLSRFPKADKLDIYELESLFYIMIKILFYGEKIVKMDLSVRGNYTHIDKNIFTTKTEGFNSIEKKVSLADRNRKLHNAYILPWFVDLYQKLNKEVFSDLFFRQLVKMYLKLNNIGLKEEANLSLADYESILSMLLKLETLGFTEEILFDLLDRLAISINKIYFTSLNEDESNQLRDLLVNRLRGVLIEESDPSIKNNSDLTVFYLHKGSFIYSHHMNELNLNSGKLTKFLNWLLIISYSNILIPDLNEIILQVSHSPTSNIEDFKLLLRILIDQLMLNEAAMSNCFIKILEFLNYQIFKSSFSGQYPGNPQVYEFIELAIIITYIISGNILRLTKVMDQIKTKIRLRLQDYTSYLPQSEHITQLFNKFMMSLIINCDPSYCSFPILCFHDLVQTSTEKSWINDKSLTIKIWSLLNPEYGSHISKVADIFLILGVNDPTSLIETILPRADAPWEIHWQWLDSAFGFFTFFPTENKKEYKNIWKFVGPIFDTFAYSSLLPKDAVRTKFETLARSLEKKTLNSILKTWGLYFSLSTIEQKIITCKLMTHLNIMFPHWSIVKWSILSGALLQLQTGFKEDIKNLSISAGMRTTTFFDDTDKAAEGIKEEVISNNITLKLYIFSLFFQMIEAGLPILKREVYTFKFLMARALGMQSARLETNNLDCFVVLTSFEIKINDQEQMCLIQCLINKLKILFDGKATFAENDDPLLQDTIKNLNPISENNIESESIASSEAESLISIHFFDFFLTFVLSDITIESLPTPIISDIIECAMILVYKFEVDKSSHFDKISQFILKLIPLINIDTEENLLLGLLNLNFTILSKAPKLTQSTLLHMIIPMSYIAVKSTGEGLDAPIYKARSFLNTVFSNNTSNGLITLIFKTYDYNSHSETLFNAMKLTLGSSKEDLLNSKISEDQFHLYPGKFSSPIYDIISHFLTFQESDYKSLKSVLDNLSRYVILVYHKDYDSKLIDSTLTQLPPVLTRHIHRWDQSHVDLTSTFLLLYCILKNNGKFSDSIGNSMFSFIDSVTGEFLFKSISLELLLEIITQLYSDTSKLEEVVKYGYSISEALSKVLLSRPSRNTHDQVISLCHVILHKEDPNLGKNIHLAQYILKNHTYYSNIEELLSFLKTHTSFYLPFQKLTENLFFDIEIYLREPINFKKSQANCITAAVLAGHLAAILYVEKHILPSAVLEWLRGLNGRNSLLSVVWFIYSLVNLPNVCHLDIIHTFQNTVLNVIITTMSQPISTDLLDASGHIGNYGAGQAASEFSFIGQNLCFAILLVKIWISLFSKVENPLSSKYTISNKPQKMDIDDEHYITSIQSSFWLILWPAILESLIPDSNSVLVDPEKQTLLIELFAEVVAFLPQCHSRVFPTNFQPEWLAFFHEFSQLIPSISKEPKYLLALSILQNETVITPLTHDQVTMFILKEIINALHR